MPAPTNSERIHELTRQLARLEEHVELILKATEKLGEQSARTDVFQERFEATKAQTETLVKVLDKVRDSHELSQQNFATAKQQIADLDRRIDRWSLRGWSLISLLIGALLSLAAGLIVTLGRKSP